MLVGLFLLPQLPIRLNPEASLPSITIQLNYPNSSPYVVEKEVTSKVEAACSIVEGIVKVSSKSSFGSGLVTIEFNNSKDMDLARFEISSIVKQISDKLPKQTTYPLITINQPNRDFETAFLVYTVSGDYSGNKIEEITRENIIPKLNGISGIDKTVLYGSGEEEYILSYDNTAVKKLGLTRKDMIDGLSKYYKKESLGKGEYDGDYFPILLGPKEDELNLHVPLKAVGKKIIHLDDIASVRKTENQKTEFYRYNGENATTLTIFAKQGTNTINLAGEVKNQIRNSKKTLPDDFEINLTYDSTDYVIEELNNIIKRAIYAVLILILFVYLASRSLKYLLVILISITANLLLAFFLYYVFDVEVHFFSLAGITISLGLIVDNSIMMIDFLRKERDLSIFLPLLASTLTTICALSVLFFIEGDLRLDLIDFTLIIIINLSISLMVAFFLIPNLVNSFKLKAQKIDSTRHLSIIYENIVLFVLKRKKIATFSIILFFGIPLFLLPEKLEGNGSWYSNLYNSTLGSNWYVKNLKPSLDQYLGGTLQLFSKNFFANSQLMSNERDKLFITASAEKDLKSSQLNEVFLSLESFLKNFSQIDEFSTRIFNDNRGRIEISFVEEKKDGNFPLILKSRISRRLLEFGGIDWNVFGVGNGFSNKGGVNESINFFILAKGYNYEDLNIWSDSLATILTMNPRVDKTVVRENSFWRIKPSQKYNINYNSAENSIIRFGPSQVSQELKNLAQTTREEIFLSISSEEVNLKLESTDSRSSDLWGVQNKLIERAGHYLSLKNSSTIVKKQIPDNIYKENQEYLRLIEFNYFGARKSGSLYLEQTLKKFRQQIPIGYSFKRTERFWRVSEYNLNDGLKLLFFALLLIYVISTVFFESLKQPFIILSVVPISFIGIFLTFYLFDINFDQGGIASFILISGITINASIFILNTYNSIKKRNPEKGNLKSYIDSCQLHFPAILLTVFSTLISFVPFLVDGGDSVFWYSLSSGLIGGLLFSLFAILIYLPIFVLSKKDGYV